MEKFGQWLVSFLQIINSSGGDIAAIAPAVLAGAQILNDIVGPNGEEAGDPILTKMGAGMVLMSAAIKIGDLAALYRLSSEFAQMAEAVRLAQERIMAINDELEKASPLLARANGMIDDYELREQPLLLIALADASSLFSSSTLQLVEVSRELKLSMPLEYLEQCHETVSHLTSSYKMFLDHLEHKLGEEALAQSGLQPKTGQC